MIEYILHEPVSSRIPLTVRERGLMPRRVVLSQYDLRGETPLLLRLSASGTRAVSIQEDNLIAVSTDPHDLARILHIPLLDVIDHNANIEPTDEERERIYQKQQVRRKHRTTSTSLCEEDLNALVKQVASSSEIDARITSKIKESTSSKEPDQNSQADRPRVIEGKEGIKALIQQRMESKALT